MHPSFHAQTTPDKPAAIMLGTGEVRTYQQLDAFSNQFAHLFRSLGCQPGDLVALMMENSLRVFDLVWAAQRAGLYVTCISNHLTPDEISYIVKDCGAKVFITSLGFSSEALAVAPDISAATLLMEGLGDGQAAGFRDLSSMIADMPTTPVADQSAGADILYSSGTTGRPKGVKSVLTGEPIETPTIVTKLGMGLYGMSADTVYLSPAPLYHAAPLRWCQTVHSLGGTTIIMPKFDAEQALAAIETYQINASQWVPTHFIRMLKLPEDLRATYDLSSMKTALLAAAPCPAPVKQAMIDWWGPVIYEYYAGTEAFGFSAINSEEWQQRPGSVGKVMVGIPHVCGEDGEELPIGEEGEIFFENDNLAEYHNDPEKTAAARNQHGWATYGDVGRLDEDGYLYLTDRKNFMIISGGVNIYPAEIENHLVTHPQVDDVAVFGVPDAEMGERVVAVVQPVSMDADLDALRADIEAFARTKLSGVKIPRQIDFRAELPRIPTGKMIKRLIQDEYRAMAAKEQNT